MIGIGVHIDKYQNTYKEILQKGLKYHTKSFQIQTSLYGSNIGSTSQVPTIYFQGVIQNSTKTLSKLSTQ